MISNLTDIKLQQLKFEETYLSSFSTKSECSLGRKREELPCAIRTEFQRDRDRILHSKAFRRLKHKTQVFISPKGDHYRTRITHTLEVSQISRTIARALRLNEDLTEAIALGHDLGHTPFGHSGEEVLNELMPGGFRHNEQSVRVISIIEDLNLTSETIDGILNHTGKIKPFTMEGQIVKISDRIAYLNHDIDDAIRAEIIKAEDIPENCVRLLGAGTNERITSMVMDIIQNSLDKDEILMSDKIQDSMNELRDWMFENVYIDSPAKNEEHKARRIVSELYKYYINNYESTESIVRQDNEPIERSVADYIAGMTDRFAIQQYVELFVPLSWSGAGYSVF
ncbi:MAG: deoxyguanosinetriphosphate triphosphohydrolase [Candidatus Gastranaerophilales bacterium]|nr:deoxyguanosinetriphosphate triphosphohydrolase [Candidatus Gastranaerophilales bacterium]